MKLLALIGIPLSVLVAMASRWTLALFLVLNVTSFVLYYVDKQRAIKGEWRIPERTLLIAALVGGAVGAELARIFVRHKTRKAYFSAAIFVGSFTWLGTAFGMFYLMGAFPPAAHSQGMRSSTPHQANRHRPLHPRRAVHPHPSSATEGRPEHVPATSLPAVSDEP